MYLFEASDLERTLICAQDKDGEYGSFSFRDLLNANNMPEIIKWFGQRMIAASGYADKETTDESAVVNMCRIVECIEGPMIKNDEPRI